MAQVKATNFASPKMQKVDGGAVFINQALTVATNPAANDTLDFFLPKGFELSFLSFSHTALAASGLAGKIGFASLTSGATTVSANGDPVMAVDDDYFKAAGTFGLTATGFVCYFKPITFEEDVYLRLTCTVTATTFLAGFLYATMGGNMIGVK